MGKRNKLWLSMQAVTFASITTLAGCADSEGEGEKASAVDEKAAASAQALLLEGEGEGGEGEGEGEGEGSSSTDLTTDDLAYLTQIALMRGHLLVGYQLYKDGHIEHAKTHMKHPQSELYAAMEPAFAARGANGFADELSALADSVADEEAIAEVTSKYNKLLAAITGSEFKVQAQSAAAKLDLTQNLLKVAGEEYAVGIVNGKLENAHEYQDAYGFTQTAKAIVASINGDDNIIAARDKTLSIISGIEHLWPSVVPPESLDADASELYGAAAQIELLALGLE